MPIRLSISRSAPASDTLRAAQPIPAAKSDTIVRTFNIRWRQLHLASFMTTRPGDDAGATLGLSRAG
jgi:hypothetical protein